MRIRTTVILFGLFAAALLGFAAFQWLGVQTADEKKHAERFVFPSLNPMAVSRSDPQAVAKGPQQAKAEDFTRLVIERHRNDSKKTQRLEFVRAAGDKDSGWRMIAPHPVRTDDSAVTTMITSLITLEKQKARDLGRDLAKYGLDQPDTLVTMTRKDNTDFVLSIAAPGADAKDPALFATSSESGGRPVVFTKAKIEKVFEPIAAFRQRNLIGSSFDITGIRLAGTGRSPVELSKDPKDWIFKEPPMGDADAAATDELGRNLASMRVERDEDFILDGSVDQAKLDQYGLVEEKAPYVFTITRKAFNPQDKPIVEKVIVGKGDESAVEQAKKGRQAALAIESALISPTAATLAYLDREKQKVEPAYYYARRGDDQSVVRIPARNLPFLQKAIDELRAKGLAKVDNSKVDAVNLTAGGEALRFRRPDLKGAAHWDIYADKRAKTAAHTQVVQNLLDALAKIEIKDPKAFLDDDAKIKSWFGSDTIDLGLDQPQAELHVWQEAIVRDKDEKPEGSGEPRLKESGNVKPTVKLSIGKKDAKRGVVYIRREVPGLKATILAVADPFISGNATLGAQQSFAQPPDGRQTISLTALVSGGYLAFREHTLPSYRMDQIASMEIKRPSSLYLVEAMERKDEQGHFQTDWKLKKPVEETANASSAALIANSLIGTSAEKLLADKPTDKELDETYGLTKAPLLVATVKTKGETAAKTDSGGKEAPQPKPGSTYTYTIGKKLPESSKYPNHYSARLQTTPGEGTAPEANQFVFAVPLSYLQSLDLELRNTTIFPMDTAKPLGLSFSWFGQGADQKPLVTRLELALTADKWELKALTENGADAKSKLSKFDAAKANALMGLGSQPHFAGPRMNPLVADRFVQHGGALDPKYRLDPAKTDQPPRLIIEVKYSDGKARTLILGETFKPSEADFPALSGTYYYATTPGMPGVVILLNELEWRDLVAGALYFQESPPKPGQ